jgi:hypothetical protein
LCSAAIICRNARNCWSVAHGRASRFRFRLETIKIARPRFRSAANRQPARSRFGGRREKLFWEREASLLGNIRRLNAAAGTQEERPFVVTAVSRVTGVSERELEAQQDISRLRFGELCGINIIAGRDGPKSRKSRTQISGRSWTDLARANGLSIASVVQVTRNANELTISSYSNSAEHANGGQQVSNRASAQSRTFDRATSLEQGRSTSSTRQSLSRQAKVWRL